MRGKDIVVVARIGGCEEQARGLVRSSGRVLMPWPREPFWPRFKPSPGSSRYVNPRLICIPLRPVCFT
ncbi:hypothetical protein CGCF415_v012556 [Colletotrichum fructicola]|nr:hypothetical protein CGCFRS4_v010829 [Colletotrichum fructicola]KAF4893600.1 hypothetical protein CGCF415_v012556 [Colletotrichum fructicola]KAF4928740.1 hypothetical protein CGCF245_v012516 [Colletotrichum fructicola]